MREKGKFVNKSYYGERVHTAKLTAEDVKLIDALLADDAMSMNKIAQKFDVSRNTIWNIAHGNTWKQVTGAGL